MMRRVEDIESAFERVKGYANEAASGDEASKDRSFEEIFALNNAIGRLGRERPHLMPRMRELQSFVNAITVGIKYGRAAEVSAALAATEGSIEDLRKELSSAP